MATMMRERIARKRHACASCGGNIEPGQRYQYWSCTPQDAELNQSDHWWNIKQHVVCIHGADYY